MAAPSMFSVTEVAFLVGIKREQVRYLVKRGALQTFRLTGNARGKRMVTLEALELAFPDAYDSILGRISRLAGKEDDPE